MASAAQASSDRAAADRAVPAVAAQQVRVVMLGLPEEAAMVLVGSVLIGLAAAVRRVG